jgi:hypothetical protein
MRAEHGRGPAPSFAREVRFSGRFAVAAGHRTRDGLEIRAIRDRDRHAVDARRGAKAGGRRATRLRAEARPAWLIEPEDEVSLYVTLYERVVKGTPPLRVS